MARSSFHWRLVLLIQFSYTRLSSLEAWKLAKNPGTLAPQDVASNKGNVMRASSGRYVFTDLRIRRPRPGTDGTPQLGCLGLCHLLDVGFDQCDDLADSICSAACRFEHKRRHSYSVSGRHFERVTDGSVKVERVACDVFH